MTPSINESVAKRFHSPHPPLPHTPREGGVWPLPTRKCEKGRRVGAALWRLLLLSCGASKLGRVFALVSEFYEHPTKPGMFPKLGLQCS